MSEQWYAASELTVLNLPGMPSTTRGIQLKASSENWPSRPRAGRGGGKEYPVSALPQAARDELARRAASEAAAAGRMAGVRQKIAEAVDAAVCQRGQEAGLAGMLGLQTGARQRAEARLAVVSAFRQFLAACGRSESAAATLFAAAWERDDITVEAGIKAALPQFSARSVLNWHKEVTTAGVTRLAGNYGRHRVGSGVIDSDSDLRDFVLAMMAEHQNVEPKKVMRGLRVRFEEGRLPSFRTLQRWMADWRAKNAQLDLFVNHPDAWRSRYKAAGGNAAADVHGINDRWEIDSTKADLLLSDGRRHVIVGVIDVWTRRLKLLVSRSSSSEAVCGLLRRSLLDWGVPKIVRSDNGSDYVSARVRAVLVGLDIHQDMAPPYTPEHKPFIERAFGTFNHDLMELLPGYVGHDVAERKAIESRKSFAQRMMTEGERLDIRMTAAELQDFCDRWADSLYAHEPHSGLDGATPFARAASWTAPLRRIENERALDVLLAEPVTRDGLTVGKKGLKINRHTYDAPELGGLEGQRVTARWDETDMARVHVFDDSGAYVGMAVCPELADLAGVGVTRQQITAERKVRQRKVMADGKRELRKIANKVGVADIAREIISEAARASRKVIDLPRPSITHSTPALSEAARATARPVTPDLTPAQARLQAEIAADLSAAKTAAAPRSPATVVALGSPEARFARALEIEARQARGEEVADADARWLSRYRNQPEYRTGKLMQEDFKSVGYVPVTA